MRNRFRQLPAILFCLFLMACSNTSEIDQNLTKISTHNNWQDNKQALAIEHNWLAQLENIQVQDLVEKALAANHQFAIQAYDLESAEQQVIISGSQLWPELDFAFRSDRNNEGVVKCWCR